MAIANKSRWPSRLVLGAVLLLFGATLWLGARRPVILVVHSQSERIPWTHGIDTGIDRVLPPTKGVRLQRMYLQTQDGSSVSNQVHQTELFVERRRPDVVMLIDDLAQARLGSTLAAQGRPAIVYSGIEDPERSLANSTLPQIQGIAERTPWPMVESSLLQMARLSASAASPLPASPRIALISDTGPAAEEEAQGFAQHIWHTAQPVGVWRCASLDEWLRALDEIANKADIVVIGDYRYLQAPDGFRAQAWRERLAQAALERLSQPMTALSAYAVAEGIPMGILPSPVEQGEVAAQMALQAVQESGANLASATMPEHARHAQTQNFALLLNQQQMAQRSLSVDAMNAYYARVSARLIGTRTP